MRRLQVVIAFAGGTLLLLCIWYLSEVEVLEHLGMGSGEAAVFLRKDSRISESISSCQHSSIVDSIKKDPCYWPEYKEDLKQCTCQSTLPWTNKIVYTIPKSVGAPITPQISSSRAVLVFIHVNKAGGSLIKRNVIFPAMIANKWDGAGFGTFKAWKELGKPFGEDVLAVPLEHENDETKDKPGSLEKSLRPGEPSKKLDEPLYIKCGQALGDMEEAGKTDGCGVHAVWGGMSMGLCDHFPARPCFYVTVLREPVERAISNYNYVCVRGAENRKKWTPAWRKAGRCPLTIRQFYDAGLAEPDFLAWRLTRSCDEGCASSAAIENLKSPCMRYLLLDRLGDGVARLQQELGDAYAPSLVQLTAFLASGGTTNKAKYADRTMEQLEDPETIKNLTERLKGDIKIYRAAVDYYEKQWQQPLQSCNTWA